MLFLKYFLSNLITEIFLDDQFWVKNVGDLNLLNTFNKFP